MKERIILSADAGKKLTDGTDYFDDVILEIGRSKEDFCEITEEEYKTKMKEVETENTLDE